MKYYRNYRGIMDGKTDVRQLNALLTAMIIISLLVHLIGDGLLMFGLIPYLPVFKYFGIAAAALIFIHVVIGICLVAARLRNKTKVYAGINKGFFIQHISALFIIILTAVHIAAFANEDMYGVLYQSTLVSLIFAVLLTLSIALHCITGIPRVVVRFGLLTTKAGMKKLYAVTYVFVLLIAVYALLGFANYYLISLGGL